MRRRTGAHFEVCERSRHARQIRLDDGLPVRYLSDMEAALGERKVDLLVEGPTRKNGYIDRVAPESGVLL